jgi:hypothetical protein
VTVSAEELELMRQQLADGLAGEIYINMFYLDPQHSIQVCIHAPRTIVIEVDAGTTALRVDLRQADARKLVELLNAALAVLSPSGIHPT